jgi:hypothetical protein
MRLMGAPHCSGLMPLNKIIDGLRIDERADAHLERLDLTLLDRPVEGAACDITDGLSEVFDAVREDGWW